MFVVAALIGSLPTWGGEVGEGGGKLSPPPPGGGELLLDNHTWERKGLLGSIYAVIRCGEILTVGGGGYSTPPPQGGREVGKVLLIMWGVGAISVVEHCVAVLLFLFLDFKLGPDCYY
jgi:hypothetical protein